MILAPFKRKAFLAILAISWYPFADGGIVLNSYRGPDSWRYLSRFCYAPTRDDARGVFEAQFIYPENAQPVVAIYYLHDEDQSEFNRWQSIYRGNSTCAEKLDMADQVYTLSDNNPVGSSEFLSSKISVKVATTRARWIFVTVCNCARPCQFSKCISGLDISYQLNFTNSGALSFYVSFEQQGILELDIVFIVVYALLGLKLYLVRRALVDLRKYHHIVKLLAVSVVCSFCFLVLETIDLLYYALVGLPLAEEIKAGAAVLKGCAEFSLLIQAFLIAKGWTIVRRKISANGRMRLSIYITFYVWVYWACLLYYRYGIDPADIAYVYNTWPGYVLVVLRVCGFIWLCRSVRLTLLKYGSKRAFYTKYLIVAGAWMLSLPVCVLINLLVVEYYRFKVLYTFELLVAFIAQAVLLCIASFPFHATTAAMLHGRRASNGHPGKANSMRSGPIQRASDISEQIKTSLTTLNTLSKDLAAFLAELSPANDELEENDEDLQQDGNKRAVHVDDS